ncbi:hypothetical protein C8R47DRAFT_401908 [Mycena vitilis]|nr:hypothetical protein C8R47DRAFT_401908 [Mycena vitilis]
MTRCDGTRCGAQTASKLPVAAEMAKRMGGCGLVLTAAGHGGYILAVESAALYVVPLPWRKASSPPSCPLPRPRYPRARHSRPQARLRCRRRRGYGTAEVNGRWTSLVLGRRGCGDIDMRHSHVNGGARRLALSASGGHSNERPRLYVKSSSAQALSLHRRAGTLRTLLVSVYISMHETRSDTAASGANQGGCVVHAKRSLVLVATDCFVDEAMRRNRPLSPPINPDFACTCVNTDLSRINLTARTRVLAYTIT